MKTEAETRVRVPRPPGGRRSRPARPGRGAPATSRAGGRTAYAPPPGSARQAAALSAGTLPGDVRAGAASAALHVPRTRFILLVLGMLGGGLVCLLVINTTLAAASFRINSLQRGNVALAQREQVLQQEVTAEESPSVLQREALRLGMRTQPLLNFLDLRTGRVYRQPASVPGVPNVPGYAP